MNKLKEILMLQSVLPKSRMLTSVVDETLRDETRANTRFNRASVTVMRAPQQASTRPLIGCSPIAVAAPT